MRKYIPRVPPSYDKKFPDFALRDVEYFNDGAARSFKLLLPATEQVDQLLLQCASDARNREAEFAEERARKIDEERAARHASKPEPSPFISPRKKDADQYGVIDARAELRLQFDFQREQAADAEQGGSGKVQVYAWDEPVKLLAQASSNPDRQLRDRDRVLFDQLKALGAFRQVSRSQDLQLARDSLKALRDTQPHFGEVIDLIEGQVHLALELGHPLRIPPILIAGAPGVGKTHFTLELARCLARPIHRHSFDAAHTSDALTGSDRHWANTEVGLVFRGVCLGKRADPVILMDEIDKTSNYRSTNPLAPLHSLLEPVTACAVVDISSGIQFDASHVLWVATANDLAGVPEPIQSRFRIFHIQSPSAEQAIVLAQNVASSVHRRYPGFEAPPRRLFVLLAHATPREQIQALEQAYARALVNGRRHLTRQDLPMDVLGGDPGETSDDRCLH
ncbi:AAA family ATPase [Hydrogenophaga sp.]|uniref:AAA family ATPase n=1 Tax=Hydrogenophaga sp. TaxID=1904254 RepID=UPI002633EE4F|nr:AAA family ATPase [Hydrogenophaga sp.]MDM7951469.1 AAA family ATPase [Hydrogenophaga sp.]